MNQGVPEHGETPKDYRGNSEHPKMSPCCIPSNMLGLLMKETYKFMDVPFDNLTGQLKL